MENVVYLDSAAKRLWSQDVTNKIKQSGNVIIVKLEYSTYYNYFYFLLLRIYSEDQFHPSCYFSMSFNRPSQMALFKFCYFEITAMDKKKEKSVYFNTYFCVWIRKIPRRRYSMIMWPMIQS